MGRINHNELDRLERRAFHLTILASVFVMVLAGGVALLMYPLVFVHPDEANKWPLRFAFFGFCILTLLFVAYLLDRHRMVRNLKQQLVEELDRNLELRFQAHADILHTLPDLSHFQDQLAMAYRRASNMQRPLTLLAVKVKVSVSLADEKEKVGVLGEAAKAISNQLRTTDSLYSLAEGLFGLVMPDTDLANAKRFAMQLEGTLKSVGSPNRFSFEITTRNYPEHVSSAHEFEEVVSSLLPEKSPWAEVLTSR
jgi:GGDEF domain-containing protein